MDEAIAAAGRTGPVRWRGMLAAAALGLGLAASGCQSVRNLPDGLSFAGKPVTAERVAFLKDITFTGPNGERHTHQEIFDHWFRIIAGARRFILVDMFLYNDFQGPVPEHTRGLTRELTEALLRQKRAHPAMRIVVITDPVNTAYGGVRPEWFERLKAAGIEVHITDLTKLRDSNPGWSVFWRALIRPLGNNTNGRIPGPFSHGPITVRSYLSFLNLKANHRKVLVADKGETLAAMVTSGNTHDASSAHSNVALSLEGPAAHDLLETENAVLAFSGGTPVKVEPPRPVSRGGVSVEVMTESKVRDDVIETLDGLKKGDRFDSAMFFLSHRRIIAAMKAAAARGADIRLLLDPNTNAFGVNRGGVPNKPVASELKDAGIAVRWCEPRGEQCHSKIMMVERQNGSAWMSLGSSNLTRRNLDDFNLETNLVLRGKAKSRVFQDASAWFRMLWANQPGRTFSVDFERHASRSVLKRAMYHFMEASGWSTW